MWRITLTLSERARLTKLRFTLTLSEPARSIRLRFTLTLSEPARSIRLRFTLTLSEPARSTRLRVPQQFSVVFSLLPEILQNKNCVMIIKLHSIESKGVYMYMYTIYLFFIRKI